MEDLVNRKPHIFIRHLVNCSVLMELKKKFSKHSTGSKTRASIRTTCPNSFVGFGGSAKSPTE